MFAEHDVAKAIEKLIREIVAAQMGEIGAHPNTFELVMALERLMAEAKGK